jgi:hypothetical protein
MRISYPAVGHDASFSSISADFCCQFVSPKAHMRKRKSWTIRAKGVILSVSEIERRQLHKEVENIMSDDSAAVLMRLLPPVGWNDFATKQDLETLGKFMQLGFNNSLLDLRNEMRKEFVDETGILRNSMHGEFVDLRNGMQDEFASFRNGMQDEFASFRKEVSTEFSATHSEMNTEFAAVRSEMNTEFAAVRSEMNTEFAAVRSELHHEIDGLRKEMNAGFLDLRKEMNNQTHRMFMAMLGINTLLMSVAIAAFKLL